MAKQAWLKLSRPIPRFGTHPKELLIGALDRHGRFHGKEHRDAYYRFVQPLRDRLL